jgi:hypothetical protein
MLCLDDCFPQPSRHNRLKSLNSFSVSLLGDYRISDGASRALIGVACWVKALVLANRRQDRIKLVGRIRLPEVWAKPQRWRTEARSAVHDREDVDLNLPDDDARRCVG